MCRNTTNSLDVFRFGLTDDKRIGNSILMSPLGDVAAVNDNFGRISIIDMSYGIAVRYLTCHRSRIG